MKKGNTLRKQMRRGAIAGAFGATMYMIGGWAPVFWKQWTDDGYGRLLPPEEIEAAPAVFPPWPEIAPPGPDALSRLSRADLKRYFFPEDASDPDYGLVIRRFDQRPVALRNSGEGREGDREVVALYNRIRSTVPALPEGYDKYGTQDPPGDPETNAQISVYSSLKRWKPEYRYKGAMYIQRGIDERMTEQGCRIKPGLFVTGLSWKGGGGMPTAERYRMHRPLISIHHRLGEPTVDHCLFRAMTVALGLHPTEAWFFDPGPVTPDEQARALAALALVYHPAVKPGMDEETFIQTLLDRDLIEP
jgi:hypothetical protein